MKKTAALLLICVLFAAVSGCANTGGKPPSGSPPPAEAPKTAQITDVNGNSFTVPKDARVVSLYASFADGWLLAGGTLAGVTDDAFEEPHRPLPEGIAAVGSLKNPNLEKILALSPGYVILSADIAGQAQMEQSFIDLGIPYGYFRVDTFSDYEYMMGQFCAATGREDLYRQNVSDVKERIDAVLADVPEGEGPSVLLIRAFSSGVRAKTDDNLAGVILKELGCRNIADAHPSLLEDLSLEEVILQDPDFIFVLTMGDEKEALAYLSGYTLQNPAWNGLAAVKAGRYHVLPKELFHNKPNEKWDQSYAYLADILYET